MELLSPQFTQIILILAFVIPAILFVTTQYKTLKTIQPKNRRTSPWIVWLQFIPILNFIWQFVVVSKISGSIKDEFAARADESSLSLPSAEVVAQLGKRPTLYIGLAYCILITPPFLMNFFMLNPPIYGVPIMELAGITCWIIYWVNLAKYKRILKRNM